MWKSMHSLLLLQWLLLLLFLCSSSSTAETGSVSVTVVSGPTKDGACSEAIQAGNYARIHFTVSIDQSSQAGEPGKVIESTQGGQPIGVSLGIGEVIPAWDQALVGLCAGDHVVLVVPPALAYGDDGTGEGPDDIPGGATILFEIEIVSVLEGPHEDDNNSEEEARAMFQGADENADGKLSRAEFDAMFVAQIGEVAGAEEMNAIQMQLDHFWNSQDFDGDGYLSLEEFLSPSAFDSHDEDDPIEEFKALDTDQDGKLSKEEVETFFASLGQEVPEDFWVHLDEDKDGFISFNEFFSGEDDYEDYEGEEEEPDL